eukprot:768263-Hanusia_phi.AAC.6
MASANEEWAEGGRRNEVGNEGRYKEKLLSGERVAGPVPVLIPHLRGKRISLSPTRASHCTSFWSVGQTAAESLELRPGVTGYRLPGPGRPPSGPVTDDLLSALIMIISATREEYKETVRSDISPESDTQPYSAKAALPSQPAVRGVSRHGPRLRTGSAGLREFQVQSWHPALRRGGAGQGPDEN